MANNCYYDMNIVGKESAVNELLDMLKWEGPEENPGLGRVFSVEEYDRAPIAKEGEEEIVSVKCNGDCAWSVYSSMLNDGTCTTSLESETKRLGLALEVYSSEPGIGFQEHYIIDKGRIILEEEKDYQEHWIEMMDKDLIIEVCEENGIPHENVNDYINEFGDLCVGGFGEEFGCFSDLSEYVKGVSSLEEEKNNAYKLINSLGTVYTVYPHLNSYVDNDNLYVGLDFDDPEEGSRDFYGSVTVNIGALPYLESAIDVNNNGDSIISFLELNGFGSLTGKAERSGFCSYPVFRFREDKLREIDPEVFAEYAKAHGREVSKGNSSLDAKIQAAENRQVKEDFELNSKTQDKER